MLTTARPATPRGRRADRALRLRGALDKPIRVLSGGTRQKVNAVLAFLFRPELLILDEPTAGLDPVSSGILKDKILAEQAAGQTFLLTSHIMSELDELADDVAFLNEGECLRRSGAELKRVTDSPTSSARSRK